MADRVSVRLTVDGSDAETAFKGFASTGVTSIERVRVALGGLKESGSQVRVAIDQVDPSMQRLAGSLNALRSRYGDSYRSQQQFTKAQDVLGRSVEAGLISLKDSERTLALVSAGHKATATSAAGLAAAHVQLSTQGMEAFHVMRSMTEQMAMGVPVTQLFAQHISQLSYAASGPGGLSASFGQVTTLLRGFITPTTATFGGLAALGVGIGIVVAHAVSLEAEARGVKTTLDAMGTSSLASSADFVRMTRDLEAMGLAAADARAALLDVIRTQGVNPAFAGRIVATGANAAAAFGGDAGANAKELATGLGSQSLDALIKLGLQWKAFDASEAQNLCTMALHGEAVKALNRGFGEIEQTLSGKLQQTMSELAKSTAAFASTWERMLDACGNSGPFQVAIGTATMLLDVVAKLSSGQGLYDKKGLAYDLGLDEPAPPQTAMGRLRAARAAAGLARPADGGAGYATNFSIRPGVNMGGEAGAYADMLSHAAEQLPPGYSLMLTSADRPQGSRSAVGMNSAHVGGFAADFQVIGPNGERYPNTGAGTTGQGLYGRTFAAARDYAQWAYPQMQVATGAVFGANGGPIRPGSPADIGHIYDAAARGGAAGPVIDAPRQGDLAKLKETEDQYGRLNAAARQWGEAELYAKTYAEALASSTEAGDAKIWSAEQQASQAVEAHRIALSKTAEIQADTTRGALATAEAYGKDEVGGLQAAARAQAELAVKQGEALDVGQKTGEILAAGAAEAIGASAKAIPGLIQTTAASQRLADAAKQGTAAEHEAAPQNQATAATHDALAKAIATGNPALVAQARALTDKTAAQIKANDAAQTALKVQQDINQRADQAAVVKLQTSLQGQTPEDIAKATSLLQEEQRLRGLGVNLSSDTAKNDLASVTALADANKALAESTRNWQRIEEGVRQVADTIDTTLISAIEGAFDKTKVTDWTSTLKSALTSIGSQLLNATLIKPALGQPLGFVGWGNFGQAAREVPSAAAA